MCSVARPSALGFDATAFLCRRWGVAAAIAPAARGVMVRDPPDSRTGTMASSASRAWKCPREILDGKAEVKVGFSAGKAPAVIPTPPGLQQLQERMRAELDAVRTLYRKAMLLCRGGAGTSSAGAVPTTKGNERFSVARLQRKAPLEAAAKRRKESPLKLATEAAAHQKMTKEQVKQLGPVKRAAPPPNAKEDAEMRRRMEEMAREREESRRLVLAMEMVVLPDETVYRHELEELGIASF
ncbi:unnamed protein product [Urochloa humidicola]